MPGPKPTWWTHHIVQSDTFERTSDGNVDTQHVNWIVTDIDTRHSNVWPMNTVLKACELVLATPTHFPLQAPRGELMRPSKSQIWTMLHSGAKRSLLQQLPPLTRHMSCNRLRCNSVELGRGSHIETSACG